MSWLNGTVTVGSAVGLFRELWDSARLAQDGVSDFVEEQVALLSGCGSRFPEPPGGVSRVADSVISAAMLLTGASSNAYVAGSGQSAIETAITVVYGSDFSFPLRVRAYPIRRILILGETGTGKEGIARFIGEGLRILTGGKHYVPVNMAGFSRELIQSELFGHEKGAYTGATRGGGGLIGGLDDGGVLFLDEIGEASENLQASLLRFLESHTYRRVGGTSEEKRRVHVVAATNRTISELSAGRQFKHDLFFRLSSCVIKLPPLRELLKDPGERRRIVKQLIDTEIQELSGDSAGMTTFFNDGEIFQAIQTATGWEYNWPGNLREMRNFIRALCIEGTARANDIFNRMKAEGQIDGPSSAVAPMKPSASDQLVVDIRKVLRATEETYYRSAANQSDSISAVAKLLGVTRQTASRKLTDFGLMELVR